MNRSFIDYFIGLLVVAAFIAAMFVIMLPAWGQARRCGDRESLASHLASKFSEYPAQSGTGPGGEFVELYASSGGTWTLTVAIPDGQGLVCVIASGTNWINAPAGAQ